MERLCFVFRRNRTSLVLEVQVRQTNQVRSPLLRSMLWVPRDNNSGVALVVAEVGEDFVIKTRIGDGVVFVVVSVAPTHLEKTGSKPEGTPDTNVTRRLPPMTRNGPLGRRVILVVREAMGKVADSLGNPRRQVEAVVYLVIRTYASNVGSAVIGLVIIEMKR